MVKLTKTDKIQQKQKLLKTETEKTKETKPTKRNNRNNRNNKRSWNSAYPLVTEKAVNMIDSENKITFIVNKNTNKKKVKEIIERVYNVKVDKINMVRDMKGRKSNCKIKKNSKQMILQQN